MFPFAWFLGAPIFLANINQSQWAVRSF